MYGPLLELLFQPILKLFEVAFEANTDLIADRLHLGSHHTAQTELFRINVSLKQFDNFSQSLFRRINRQLATTVMLNEPGVSLFVGLGLSWTGNVVIELTCLAGKDWITTERDGYVPLTLRVRKEGRYKTSTHVLYFLWPPIAQRPSSKPARIGPPNRLSRTSDASVLELHTSKRWFLPITSDVVTRNTTPLLDRRNESASNRYGAKPRAQRLTNFHAGLRGIWRQNWGYPISLASKLSIICWAFMTWDTLGSRRVRLVLDIQDLTVECLLGNEDEICSQ